MNWTEILIAFVAGGGIQALLNHFVAARSSKRDDFEKIVETWETDNERLRKENKDLKEEIHELQQQMDTLRIRIKHLEDRT